MQPKVDWKFIYQIHNGKLKNTYFREMLKKKTHPIIVFFCQFPFFYWQTELFIVIARSYFVQLHNEIRVLSHIGTKRKARSNRNKQYIWI